MTSPNEISVRQLSRLIGLPLAPLILDVRIDDDFAADPYLLPGAIRAPHDDIPALKAVVRGRPSVVYCQKGLKLSQGVAAFLRQSGAPSEILEGGQWAWRDAGLPMIDAGARPAPSVWVTRHRPKIDRVACYWLLRRFVDPGATVLFVAPSQVQGVAERFGAEPFDIHGARFGHHGNACSFDALLSLVVNANDALRIMSDLLRACDTGRLQDAPQAAGVSAILLGLSRLHRDDESQAEAALTVLDSLYLWARDARGETHAEGSE